MMNLKEGTLLVKTARSTVEKYSKKQGLELEKTENEKLNKPYGVFVTIKNFSEHMLRGCIGIISPTPLYEAVQRVAISAAFEDPRFSPLEKNELENTIFEISVMTEPVLVLSEGAKQLEEKIKLGRDGLIISNGNYSGLLLPQVPIEQKWNIEDFLHNLCYKAGMTPEFLSDENTKLWKFQCQIFAEMEPSGKIEEINLSRVK